MTFVDTHIGSMSVKVSATAQPTVAIRVVLGEDIEQRSAHAKSLVRGTPAREIRIAESQCEGCDGRGGFVGP